jgi:hypothetical protein
LTVPHRVPERITTLLQAPNCLADPARWGRREQWSDGVATVDDPQSPSCLGWSAVPPDYQKILADPWPYMASWQVPYDPHQAPAQGPSSGTHTACSEIDRNMDECPCMPSHTQDGTSFSSPSQTSLVSTVSLHSGPDQDNITAAVSIAALDRCTGETVS